MWSDDKGEKDTVLWGSQNGPGRVELGTRGDPPRAPTYETLDF